MTDFQFSILPFINQFDVNVMKAYKALGVHQIHYDMIDNVYYLGKGYQGEGIESLHELGFKINVHIMASDLDHMLDYLGKKTFNAVSFQIEPFNEIQVFENLKKIKQLTNHCGIAIEFTTDISQINQQIIDQIDFITLMSVKPGKGGQKFNPWALDNLNKIKAMNQTRKHQIQVHLDGGVDTNVVNLTKGLVNNYVSGSYFVHLSTDEKITFLNQIKLLGN